MVLVRFMKLIKSNGLKDFPLQIPDSQQLTALDLL